MKEQLCEKLVRVKHQCQLNSKVYKSPAPVKLVLHNLLSVVGTCFHFLKIPLNTNVFYVQIQHKVAYLSIIFVMSMIFIAFTVISCQQAVSKDSHKQGFVSCLLAYVPGHAVGLSLNYEFSLGSPDEQKIMLNLQSAMSLVLLPVRVILIGK